MIALYRCPTPSNFLCPCGAVERRLRKLGLEHETHRVPYGRRGRPEIEELTRRQQAANNRFCTCYFDCSLFRCSDIFLF
jgi:hypothetical protein